MIETLRTNYDDVRSGEDGFIDNMIAMIPDDDGREFYAVNLEQLKSGDAAEQADRAYAATVIPLLFKRAGHPVFVSERAGLVGLVEFLIGLAGWTLIRRFEQRS